MNSDEMAEELAGFNMAHTRIHSRADELIACLEGEIAKRDETIARLEPQLNRAIQANYDLREELAACRIAVENCDLFLARIAELEDDLKCAHSMLCEVSKSGMVLRAELAALKAQGVVMPELRDFEEWWCSTPILRESKRTLAEKAWIVARLNAAPAAPAADAGLVEAIDWLDDFVARCNGDDRGSCDSVNIIREALAAHRAKGVV